MKVYLFFVLTLVAFVAGDRTFDDGVSARHHHHHHRRREIWTWAWATTRDKYQAQADQLRHTAKAAGGKPLLDGIQLSGWVKVNPDTGGLDWNETMWQKEDIQILVQAALETNTKIQILISGSVPGKAIADPTRIIHDAIAIYDKLDGIIEGFSWDDERDCAPRANLTEFTQWMAFSNQFTTAMHEHGITVSSAVQALFGIQETGDPCAQVPSAYPLQPDVVDLLQTSVMDTWLIMDTYYFTTGRFLAALDWHAAYVPSHSLGIGMMNRDELTEDELVARFYALHHYHDTVHHINIWDMPIHDNFLPFLIRWKTHCRGCGKQRLLGCFDMTIDCDVDDVYQDREETA
eukprot:scaffold1007_cov176-Amphora_coffeaeformis.AAC.6